MCAMNIKMKAHTPTRREVSIRARCACRGSRRLERGVCGKRRNRKRNCLNFRFDFVAVLELELEYYSISDFECINEFELLLRVGFICYHYVNI